MHSNQDALRMSDLRDRSAGSSSADALADELSTWQVLRRLLAFQRPYIGQTLLSILLGFCTVGASVGLMATSGVLISKAALHPETILLIWVPIVGVRFFGLSRAAFRYAERYVSHDLTFRILKEIRVWLYQRLEPLVPLLWQTRRSGDVLATVTDDVDVLQNLYIRGIAPLVVAVLILLLTAIILWPLGWRASVIFSVIYVLTAICVPWLAHLLGYRAGVQSVHRKSELYMDIQDTLEGLADVVAYDTAADLLENVSVHQNQLNRQQRRLAHVQGISSALLLALNHLAMLGVLTLGILQVTRHGLPGVYLATMVFAALSAFEAIQPLPDAFQQLGECAEAGRRLFALADMPPALCVNTVDTGLTGADVTSEEMPRQAHLLVSHLGFSYPGASNRPVLTDISFDLPQGKHIAIVGATGAGKSTLLNLLSRLWAPTAGSVRIDGTDLQTIPMDAVHKWFAVVPQSAYLFHDTVRGNLGLGKAGASLDDIRAVAKKAQIDEVVTALPETYDTQVGEFGAKFSGGERQRLALARALLKDAPILLLDEPTTGLDTLTEKQFLKTFEEVATEKSVVYITHRLLGLKKFDEILVMESGRIVERGTHDELLQERGIYRGMWEIEQDFLDMDVQL